jgi:hypothetical protein
MRVENRGNLIVKLPRGVGYSTGVVVGLILGVVTGFALENLVIGLALGSVMGFSLGLALEGENIQTIPSPPKQHQVIRNVAIAGVIVLSIIVIISMSMINLVT